jgi:hypothetical protein
MSVACFKHEHKSTGNIIIYNRGLLSKVYGMYVFPLFELYMCRTYSKTTQYILHTIWTHFRNNTRTHISYTILFSHR